MSHRNPPKLVTLTTDTEVSYIFDILSSYIESQEDTELLVQMTQFVLSEIEAYGESCSIPDILKCKKLIKESNES